MKNNYILIFASILMILSYSNSAYFFSYNYRILIGYIISILGYTLLLLETEDYSSFNKGHFVLMIYYSIKVFLKVDLHNKDYDLIGFFGNLLLIKKSKYNNLGNILLTIFYSLLAKDNIMHKEFFNITKGYGALLFTIYYIKETYSYINHN